MQLNQNDLASMTLPNKLIRYHLTSVLKPIHATIYPTNFCNLRCTFCDTWTRDKSLLLSPNDCTGVIDALSNVGTKAITLSGGGEPTLHPFINEMLEYAFWRNMEIGLITNGFNLQKINNNLLQLITWIRISVNSETDLSLLNRVSEIDFGNACYSFRYVVTNECRNIEKYVEYTKARNVPLYVIGDVYNKNVKLPDIQEPHVFVENRREVICKGAQECWYYLVRPHIAADGYVYPCCLIGFDRNEIMDPKYRLCHYTKLEQLVEKQEAYNGSLCGECFLNMYNKILSCHKSKPHHDNFV